MKKIVAIILAILALNILLAQEGRIEVVKDENGYISEFLFNKSISKKRTDHQTFFVSPQQKYCWIKSNLEPSPTLLGYTDFKKTKFQIYNANGVEIKTIEIPFAHRVGNIVEVKDNGVIFFNKPSDKINSSNVFFPKDLIIFFNNGRKEIKTGIFNINFTCYRIPETSDFVIVSYSNDGSMYGSLKNIFSIHVFTADGELLGNHSIDKKYVVRISDAKFISENTIRFFGFERRIIENENGYVMPDFSSQWRYELKTPEIIAQEKRGDFSFDRKRNNLSFHFDLNNMTVEIKERTDD